MEDKRFSHIATDPKFRRIPKGERKVKIDKRFQSMFKDKQFKVKYTVDKRGRPVNHTSTEDLKRYYHISSEEESDSEESESEKDQNKIESKREDSHEANSEKEPHEVGRFIKAPVPVEEIETNELDKKHKSDKLIPDRVKRKLQNLNIDYARGEAALYSESSSDDEESDEEISEVDEIDHKWGELDADAGQTEKATYRLAACNMDWDRIRAVDMMVLFNSFLPAGGAIKSVIIYPSEFGKKRMQEEEIKGPIELVESKAEERDEENEEGSNYHMEKLRQYQLNRLKYYYAVITFDSANSANKIYTECDGMEYESSATKIDLRFIPDDMEFNEEPKELCDKLPEVNKYQPRFFTTTALQQAKVNLTWDETNPERQEIAEKLSRGKIDDIADTDIQNYLASSSDENESDNENAEESENESAGNAIDKYKALLQDIEENEKLKNKKDVEMEISWGIDLREKTEQLVKKKLTDSEERTPFQQYLEKRKEKRKEKHQLRKKKLAENNTDSESDIPSDIDMSDPYFAEEFNKPGFKKNKKEKEKIIEDVDKQKQAELELLLMNEEDVGKKHFSLKNIQEQEKPKSKKKNKHKRNADKDEKLEDSFQVNIKDERFSALFTSHHFNIDPTDPHYKKTKGMEALIQEKLKRRTDDDEPEETFKKSKLDKKGAELNVLIKSVKRKSNTFKNK